MRWDVTIYRSPILDGRAKPTWLFVIEADSYKAAFKEARRLHPKYHLSCFRIERV